MSKSLQNLSIMLCNKSRPKLRSKKIGKMNLVSKLSVDLKLKIIKYFERKD